MAVTDRELQLIIRARLDELISDLQRGAISADEFSEKATKLQAALKRAAAISSEMEELRAALAKGAISAEEFAKRTLQLQSQLQRTEQAAAALGASQGRFAQMLARNSHLLGQASFALQDFITVLQMPGMGLNAALRAASNNLAMLAMTLGGPLTGAITAVAITLLPSLIDGIRRLVSGTKDATETLKRWAEELQKLRQSELQQIKLEEAFERAREDVDAATQLVKELRRELRLLDREIEERQRQVSVARAEQFEPEQIAELERGLQAALERRQRVQQQLSRAERVLEQAEQQERREQFGQRRAQLAEDITRRLIEGAKAEAARTGRDLFEILRSRLEQVELGELGERLDIEARLRGVPQVSDLVAFVLRQRIGQMEQEERLAQLTGRQPLRQQLREQYERRRQQELEKQQREKERQEKERERQLLEQVNKHLSTFTDAMRAGGEIFEDVKRVLQEELQKAGVDAARALQLLEQAAKERLQRERMEAELQRRIQQQQQQQELRQRMLQAVRQAAMVGLAAQERGERIRRLALMLREQDPTLPWRRALRQAARLAERLMRQQFAEQREELAEQLTEEVVGFAAARGIPLEREQARRFVDAAMRGRRLNIAGLQREEEQQLFLRIRQRALELRRQQRLVEQQGFRQRPEWQRVQQAAQQVVQEQEQGLQMVVDVVRRLAESYQAQIANWQRLQAQLQQLNIPVPDAPRRGNNR